jgi:hypothetical protein
MNGFYKITRKLAKFIGSSIVAVPSQGYYYLINFSTDFCVLVRIFENLYLNLPF